MTKAYLRRNKIIVALANRLKNHLLIALTTKHPYDVALHILLSIVVALISLPLTCILEFLGVTLSPWIKLALLPIILIPVVMLLYYTKIGKFIRAIKSERELPFIVHYLYMAAAAGIAPSRALYRVKDLISFKWFKREIGQVIKIRILYALNPLDAIIYHFRYHPSQLVSKVITSVIGSERGGSDICSILKEKTEMLFKLLEEKINTIPSKYSLISSLEVLAFIVVPISILGVGSVFALLDMNVLVIYGILLPIMFAIVISLSIDTLIPKELYTTPDYKLIIVSALLSTVVFIITMLLKLTPLHIGVSLSLTLPFIPSAIFYNIRVLREYSVIPELPRIARDITEEIKKGKSPLQALKTILMMHHYPSSIAKVLRELAVCLSLGISIKHFIREKKPPRIISYFLELLNEAEGMGADPKVFETLTNIYSRIGDIYSSLTSKSRVFRIGGYISTVVMAISVTLTLNTIISLISKVYANPLTIQLPLFSPFSHVNLILIEELTKTSILLNSFLLGLLGGKGSSGSLVYGVLDAIICTLLSICVISFTPTLINLVI